MHRQKWFPDYQLRDYDLVDYQRFYVDGCLDVSFRGPPLNPFRAERGSFFTCLGAVQTYGVFYEKPYPDLLAEALGIPALNLAVGGSGPAFYTQYDRLIEAMNRGRFVVLQCQAARDSGNSRFEPDGYVGYIRDRRTGESMPSVMAWRRMVTEEPENAVRYVEEARAAWLEQSLDLISRIEVPIIYFYFSRRPPDYQIDMSAVASQAELIRSGKDDGAFVDGLMGDFPHMVDGPCVRTVAARCAAYVECLSSRGMGQALHSRFTGNPVAVEHTDAMGQGFKSLPPMTHNTYYPSQEMHADACAVLAPAARRIAENQHAGD